MLLKIQTPLKIITKEKVTKVIAEDSRGFFGILSRHIDMTTKIVASILTYTDESGEGYIATDKGIFVKQGDQIQISTRDAFESRDLGELHNTMKAEMEKESEEEEAFQRETSKLELGIVKSFYNLGQILS